MHTSSLTLEKCDFLVQYFRKGADQQPARFDKCLEDFYAICDQIEVNLVSI